MPTYLRVALLGFHHETNTFAPRRATLDSWRKAGILKGAEIRSQYGSSRATLGGFLDVVDRPGVEGVPLTFCRLTPMGVITTEAYEDLCERMLTALKASGPWDAVLLSQHGAAVSEAFADADGEFVRRVRDTVGPSVTIGATLDMHANVSRLMVDAADVVTAYQTNPHVDALERASLAATLTIRAAFGEVRPQAAVTPLPLAANILRMGTDDEPMHRILERAREAETRPGVLSVSVIEGFPYADVAQMGMSVVTVTDDKPALAQEVANEIARVAWAAREEVRGHAAGMDEALARAAAAAAGPVVLLDTGDNVGGGSPGDSSHLLHAARKLGIGGITQVLCDPDAVRACRAVGVGGSISTAVGGRTDDAHGAPFPVRGKVTAVSDGAFEDPSSTHGGFRFFDNGPTVAVQTEEGHHLVLVSRPAGTTSLEQFRLVDLEPTNQKIIAAKGVHSPRPAFEPIAKELIYVATPGCTSADISTLPFTRRPHPMYPFEPETMWNPAPWAAHYLGVEIVNDEIESSSSPTR